MIPTDQNDIDNFEEELNGFLKDILELAKKSLNQEKPPFAIEKPFYKLVDEQTERDYKFIDYDKLAKHIEDTVVRNDYPSYDKVRKIIRKIMGKQEINEEFLNLLSSKEILHNFIYMYLKEYQTNFNNYGIRGFIKDFETILSKNKYYEYWLAPLYNFTSSSETDLDLTTDMHIRKITSSEYSHIIQFHKDPIPVHDRELRFVLTSKIQNGVDVKDALKKFNDATYILKIFKLGNPNFGDIYMASEQIALSHPSLVKLHYIHDNIGKKYTINSEEWKAFKKLYSFIEVSLAKEDKTDYYPKPAIRRFGRGLNNEDKNEQIVEFVLALDSLVLLDHSGLNDFSTILPTLLFNKKSNRAYIRKFMKKMYNIRNKYIHNSEYREIKIDEKSISPEKASEELEEYTRMAFLRYLSLLKNKIDENPDRGLDRIRKEIYKDIEEAIFDQDKLEELQKCWGQFCK